MGKYLLFIVLIFCSKTSFEQVHEEYVEVIVEDSIKIDAEVIGYTLVLNAYNDVSAIDSTTITPNEKLVTTNWQINKQSENRNKEIRDLIHKLNIDTVENVSFSNTLYGNNNDIINLRFKSKTLLKQFLKEIQKFELVRGDVTLLSNSKTEKYYPLLFKKLVAHAKLNAASLAIECKKQLGSIQQVKEENVYSAGWTAYPPLGALRENVGENFETNTDYQIVLRKKFIIRYSWQ